MDNFKNKQALSRSDELKQAEWLLRIALKEFFKVNEKQLGEALKIVMGILFEVQNKACLGLAVKEGKARAKKRKEETARNQKIENKQIDD